MAARKPRDEGSATSEGRFRQAVMGTRTIHVYLPDEHVDTWRPVEAEELDSELYHILGPVPEDEIREFARGAGFARSASNACNYSIGLTLIKTWISSTVAVV